MKDRIYGCICQLDKECDPVIPDYSLCPVHSGAKREVIINILLHTGKHTNEECAELATDILEEINKV